MLLRSAHPNRRSATSGFSIVEFLMAVTLAGILGTLANKAYSEYAVRARNAAAVADIGKIKLTIDGYRLNHNGGVPESLSVIGLSDMLDPWKRPYVYLPFAGIKGNGAKRKDHNLVPINTDYDLYSVGPDGASASPLTAKTSRDDIIMANDGKYVGVASKY